MAVFESGIEHVSFYVTALTCRVTSFFTQFIFNKLCRIGEHSWRRGNILSHKVTHTDVMVGADLSQALLGLQPE